MTTQTPDAVREATMVLDVFLAAYARRSDDMPVFLDRDDDNLLRWGHLRTILAALDSRAGDAFDMPEYAPGDITHLEGLASYLDGVARDKGRAGLPASKALFEEIAKRLREYDVIRSRGRAVDAGEVAHLEGCEHSRCPIKICNCPATPAPAVDAVPAGEVETFGGVPIAAINAQMQAVEDEAARTLWIGAPLLKGLTGYIRAALSHGEGRRHS